MTHDDDFSDDRRFPLRQSPGVIILPKNEDGDAKYFPVLLRKSSSATTTWTTGRVTLAVSSSASHGMA